MYVRRASHVRLRALAPNWFVLACAYCRWDQTIMAPRGLDLNEIDTTMRYYHAAHLHENEISTEPA